MWRQKFFSRWNLNNKDNKKVFCKSLLQFMKIQKAGENKNGTVEREMKVPLCPCRSFSTWIEMVFLDSKDRMDIPLQQFFPFIKWRNVFKLMRKKVKNTAFAGKSDKYGNFLLCMYKYIIILIKNHRYYLKQQIIKYVTNRTEILQLFKKSHMFSFQSIGNIERWKKHYLEIIVRLINQLSKNTGYVH